MKRLFLSIIGVALFITVVGLYTKSTSEKNLSINTIKIGTNNIPVEVAKSDSQLQNGLSNRSSLQAENGMLFVFSKKDVQPQFWMKDMLFPIDIIWINDDKIVQIDKNIQNPATNTPDSQLTRYSPNQPIDYVLEVNLGFADNHNLSVGLSVDLSRVDLNPLIP